MTPAAHWRANRPIRAAIAVVLAVFGVVLVRASMAEPATPAPLQPGVSSEQGLPAPTATSTPPRTPTTAAASKGRTSQPDVRDQVTGLVLPESDPVAVSIPRIGVRSTLVHLGLDDKGAMEVPHNPALAGWFSRGAAPGALGPAVIAGHVTWNGTHGVFFRLGSVRRGDQVSVSREDGRTAVFTVSRVAQFSKSHFPTRQVYGAIDHAGLRLITCGGTYDSARHRYLDNVVVFADLEAVRGPGA